MKFNIQKVIVLPVVVATVVASPALAVTVTMTDAHVARIKENCPVALATLGRIHASDAPQYINSNQIYYSTGDKLMARLNSRLTLNQFDASSLVKTTSDYVAALDKFRKVYKIYDDTMSELVRMDCQRTPVTFYDRVAVAREQRGEVRNSVIEIQALISKYRSQVEKFRADNLREIGDE